MSFRQTQAQPDAYACLLRKKKIVDKISVTTPHQHPKQARVEQRKISGKNVYPTKQCPNGKDGASITDPKDIANEHAATFTDNSYSAHYNVRFQTIKVQVERARIVFTSDNTEVYNKPVRLGNLRCFMLKATPQTLPWVHIKDPQRDPE